jgi:hypothetical protein
VVPPHAHVLLNPNETVLHQVGVRTSEPDSVNLRGRFERTLATMDLRPSSMPPTAILCVRELRDRSGRLKLHTHPDFAAAEWWRRTIVSMLDDLAARAVRPAHEPVSAGTEAVLFADQAELLSCLALDWCCGRWAEHWWWAGLFPSGSRLSSWTAIWREYPESIPAAAHALADRGKLPMVARSADSVDAGQLLAALVQQFGLGEIALAFAETPRGSVGTAAPPSWREIQPANDLNAFPHPAAGSKISTWEHSLKPPPWRPWISETELPTDLGAREQCLFGIAIMLQRLPRLARSAPFATAILHWIDPPPGFASRSVSPAVATAKEESSPSQIAAAEPIREVYPDPPRPFSIKILIKQERVSETGSPVIPDSAATSSAQRSEHADSAEHSEVQPAVDLTRSPAQLDVSLPTHSPAAATEPVTFNPPTVLSRPWFAERKIETNFGGVFYLINAAQQLGLYGDFTTPLHRGLALDIWDFLALTGRELAGSLFTGDPLWTLLAQLAGRHQDDEEPGSGFETPDRWQLPPAWLEPFPDSLAWQWALDSGRLRVEHPEGFTIVDIPATPEDAGAQLRAALQGYASPFTLQMLPLASEDSLMAPLPRWHPRLSDYLRARLPRALGFPSRSADALTMLLNEPAHIVTTPTQLYLFFSLAQHPLAIRFAGLDRDPGWVPAAGRNVLFFYD